ncbi:MAG: DUF1573 domain-containing protein [Phycisphaerales bacterium]|nr:DUF1573 domain-containing protein [Phycisphaerales bacterium]
MAFAKTSVVCAAWLVLMAGSALAQPPASDPAPGKLPGGMEPINAKPALENTNRGGAFEFVTMVHDWGAISDEAPVKFSFHFKNTSNQTVKIVNTKTSCGCAVGAPTKQVLPPGEEAAIEVTYDPKGKRGLELKTITLETDYTPSPNVELHLKALVRPRLMVEPSSVWFGDLKLHEGKTQELSIMSRMEGFHVTGFTMNDPRFKVEQLPADKVEMDGATVDRVRFKTYFNDDASIGTYSTGLVITTNDPKNPTYTVSLAGRVVGELMPVPERMFVSMSAGKQPWTSEITVNSRTGSAFEIYSVEPIDCPAEMKVVLDVQPGSPAQPGVRNVYRVRASGLAPATVTEVRGSVRVRTNVSGMEEFTVPLMGLWRGPMGPTPGMGSPVMAPKVQPVKQ